MKTNLRSIYPLDELAIARLAPGKIAFHPAGWALLVFNLSLFGLEDATWLSVLPFAVASMAGLAGYWLQRWTGLLDQIRRRVVEEHNLAQSQALQFAATRLRETGLSKDARRLEEFLALKKMIEHRLYDDGKLTAQKMHLEQLVDALCFEVRDRVWTLSVHRRTCDLPLRQTVLSQIDAAFRTLLATVADVDATMALFAISDDTSKASLDELTRKLREETEIALRVQARLRSPVAGGGPPPLPVLQPV